MSTARRLAALEAEEWQRLHALPPRMWVEHGLIGLERLPAPERAELARILDRSFDDRGDIVAERLTDAERRRALELIEEIGRRREEATA